MDAFLASVAQLNDADQRAFLYSDLERQKLDNPEGYAEAVGFWAQLLVRACQRGLLSSSPAPAPAHAGDLPSVLTVDRRRLAQRLAFRGDTPMGLDAVLAELQGNGSLCAANDFFAPPALLQRLARWVAQRLLQPQPQTWQPPLLVATAAVREAAARVVEAHRARAAACPLADIMSVDEFRRAYANALSTGSTPPDDAAMSLVDAHILIRHLVDHRLAATSAQLSAAQLSATAQPQPSTARAALVKFAHPSSSSSSSLQQSPLAVTETDYATYQVMCTHRALSAQVAALETRIADLDAEARQALRRQQRPVAAARLRLKHHIETSILTKRIAALETVDRVVLQLQQTSSDIQLVQTLSAGTVALRALNDAA
ncbi:Charged multivesicular body protein 7, partial [Coemansia sp. RSA 1694]